MKKKGMLDGRYPKQPPIVVVVSDDGKVKVEFEWIGEGWDGDFVAGMDDTPLYRFTVLTPVDSDMDAWMEIDNGSYCTRVPTDTRRDEVERLARLILDAVVKPLAYRSANGHDDVSVKRILERASWLAPKMRAVPVV